MRRLYATDSYVFEFDAEVTETGPLGVALDRTAFFPESGGQPWDTGTLGGFRVASATEENGRVWHKTEGGAPRPGERVRGIVDRARRLDHMRQHSGQHVLSEAFVLAASAPTVSFHLGEKSCTIDLDVPHVGAAAVAKAEEIANETVLGDKEVRILFPGPEEAAGLRLRKPPPAVESLRVIDIGGFDVSACGGTHVSRTGEIGPVSVISTEKNKGRVRVEFLCGERALADFRARREALAGMAGAASCRFDEVAQRFTQAMEDTRTLRKERSSLKKRLMSIEAPGWLTQAPATGPARVLARTFAGEDFGLLRETAIALSKAGGAVVLFGTSEGGRAQIVFARSAEAGAVDASALMRAATGTFGGKGGGGPEFAQGGVPAEGLQAAINEAERLARAALSS